MKCVALFHTGRRYCAFLIIVVQRVNGLSVGCSAHGTFHGFRTGNSTGRFLCNLHILPLMRLAANADNAVFSLTDRNSKVTDHGFKMTNLVFKGIDLNIRMTDRNFKVTDRDFRVTDRNFREISRDFKVTILNFKAGRNLRLRKKVLVTENRLDKVIRMDKKILCHPNNL